jgi:hypothetical protein
MERVSHRSHLTIGDNGKKIILHLCLRTIPEVYGHKGKVIIINLCIFTSLSVYMEASSGINDHKIFAELFS